VTPAVGYYVHHHGRGHLSRTKAIVQHMKTEVTVFTSLDAQVAGAELKRLPSDTTPGRSIDVPVPKGLHYSPVCLPGLTERMAIMSQWAASSQPTLMVVDVSAEVATFSRLCGLPVVAVRQHGQRDDPAHLLAYDCAVGLLAPWHESLEEPCANDAVRTKTMYSGGISRYDSRMASIPRSTADSGARDRGHVLVLGGAGGEGWDFEMINRAADETPLWDWKVVGPTRGTASERVQHLGWLDDTYDLIASADVVIASAGDATVNEVMSLSRPIVCIPEARPFQEQISKARKLHKVGAAISVETWPDAGLWPSILQKALDLDCSIHRTLVDGWGAQRAAAYLDELAARFADIGSLDLARQRAAEDLDAFSFGTPVYEAHFGKGG